MSFFSKIFQKTEKTADEKLTDTFALRTGDWALFSDTVVDKEKNINFTVDYHHSCYSAQNMDKTELEYYEPGHDYYSLELLVHAQKDHLKKTFKFAVKVKEEDLGYSPFKEDAYFAMYQELKKAREDDSHPERQKEAYLVSTLLRFLRHDIMYAPLLANKEQYQQELIEKKVLKKKIKEERKQYRKQKEERRNDLFYGFGEAVFGKPKPKVLSDEEKDKRQESFDEMMSSYMQKLMETKFLDK